MHWSDQMVIERNTVLMMTKDDKFSFNSFFRLAVMSVIKILYQSFFSACRFLGLLKLYHYIETKTNKNFTIISWHLQKQVGVISQIFF